MSTARIRDRQGMSSIVPALPEIRGDNAPAWEMVGAGRYMPRRIRGSFPGRELG